MDRKSININKHQQMIIPTIKYIRDCNNILVNSIFYIINLYYGSSVMKNEDPFCSEELL